MQDKVELEKVIETLNECFGEGEPEVVIAYFLKEYKGKIALSSSLGAEDQVITKMVTDVEPATRIFTLDTGRLFSQTYTLIERTNRFFNINIETYFPDFKSVEQMVKIKGINLFYDSIENRKECCHIRKMEPLRRAFKELDVWICGLRKEQSITRTNVKMIEWDEANGLIKLNPIINWTEKQVWDYIHVHKIPYNALHDEGFPSIGCQPCTRAVEPGEDIRSGRWWWENPEHKECGLHNRR